MWKIVGKFIMMTLISLIIIGAVIMFAASLFLAKQLSFATRNTLEQERRWAKRNGIWGNLEEYTVSEYTVEGKDGYILHCELVKNDETDKYVIISHGYTSNRYGAAKYVPIYIDLGYNCIIYDLRGHGENEESICTIGNYESQDLMKLIDDTYERYGQDIYLGLHGESMGSSTSLSVLAEKPDVKFVVADCGFADLYELIGTGFKAKHVGFLEPLVNFDMEIFYGWSMKDTHAIKNMEGTEVPICFIHGKDDTFITPDNSERMQQAAGGYTELHLVNNAGHAMSRASLGQAGYEEIVRNFLDKIEE